MVQFGERPSTGKSTLKQHGERCTTNSFLGTLFRASLFLSEELPIRLAHRVQDLSHLPDGLNDMPSIRRVQDWYAQSFDVCLNNLETHLLGQILTWIRTSRRYLDQTYRKT
jgi:pyruvate dehydrogenase kinase 2/3/4